MKKSILNFGTILNKVEQKLIFGGNPGSPCGNDDDCPIPTPPLESDGEYGCYEGICGYYG